MADRLLTVREACEYLRVSRATLYRLAKDKAVALRKVRGRTVVRQAALARIPKRPASVRGGAGRKRRRNSLEVWFDRLLRAGLVSRGDRRKFLRPRYRDVEPIKITGIPVSDLVIQERREGW